LEKTVSPSSQKFDVKLLILVGMLLSLVAVKTSIVNHESRPVQENTVVQDVLQPEHAFEKIAPEVFYLQKKRAPVEEIVNNDTPQELGSDAEPNKDALVKMVQKYAKKTEEIELDADTVRKYTDLADKYATKHEIDPLWVIAMMWQESRFNKGEISDHGAIGLMQVMPSTGKELGFTPEQLHDPENNIAAGTQYLADLLKIYKGNLRMATIAYNQGVGNVERGTYRSVYYTAVSKHYNAMASLLNDPSGL
jgi:soluble lytic murein transglycosylase-like protein